MEPLPPHIRRHGAPRAFALIGNPNSGKTTLFNALTGLRQKVGNYPGVTVERKEGTCYSQHGHPLRIIDLPGTYSLVARSPDEAVARDVLLGRVPGMDPPDAVVCVVDASALERSLYLTLQVLELGLPSVVCLTMMDLADSRGICVDVGRLERRLGVPVITCHAAKGAGLAALRIAMSRQDLPHGGGGLWAGFVPPEVADAVMTLQAEILSHRLMSPSRARTEALLRLMSGPLPEDDPRHGPDSEACARLRAVLDRGHPGWQQRVIAAGYRRIEEVVAETVCRPVHHVRTATERLDAVCVHPVWGWCVLAAAMVALFLGVFTLSEPPMAAIERLVGLASAGVRALMPPGALRDLITDGILAGVGGVLVFLPQIMILFFFIGLLEATGYLARASFMLDRVMSRVGLHGKSFVPLLSSCACAVPGIMAARTIDSARQRLVTILVAPLMGCSARLPVYLLMLSVLVGGADVALWAKVSLMLALYALGAGGAFAFAWLFRRTLVRGGSQGLSMEMPAYRMPSLRSVCTDMLERALIFLRQAGTVILGLSIVLWFLMTHPAPPPGADSSSALAHSFAGRAGRLLEPVTEPLGFDWRINIGLVSSIAAREVFVSTMGVVYNVEAGDGGGAPLRDTMRAQRRPDGAPVYSVATCLSLMVFYVFAMQCVSTLVVAGRETGSWLWPAFMWAYMTAAAWVAAFAVHQAASLLGLG